MENDQSMMILVVLVAALACFACGVACGRTTCSPSASSAEQKRYLSSSEDDEDDAVVLRKFDDTCGDIAEKGEAKMVIAPRSASNSTVGSLGSADGDEDNHGDLLALPHGLRFRPLKFSFYDLGRRVRRRGSNSRPLPVPFSP